MMGSGTSTTRITGPPSSGNSAALPRAYSSGVPKRNGPASRHQVVISEKSRYSRLVPKAAALPGSRISHFGPRTVLQTESKRRDRGVATLDRTHRVGYLDVCLIRCL